MAVTSTVQRLACGFGALGLAAFLCPPRQADAGTVAYWQFEPGNFLADSAGANTLANTGVSSSADKSPLAPGAGSASFPGSQTVFSTVSTLNLSALDDLTIECFFKTTQPGLGILFEHSPANTNAPGTLGSAINDLSNELEIYQRGNSGTYLEETTLTVTNNVWHHMAFILDGSETNNTRLRLFLDGVEVGVDNPISPTGDPAARNETFYIGSRLNTQFRYVGLMDELRISDGILTPSEFLPEPTVLPLAAIVGTVLLPRRHLRAIQVVR
jgi:hypothetical protein